MGSCISCKSDGRALSYTTISMESDKIGDSSLNQGAVYARNNNISSFGFKRRAPTALKSLSQQRTSELVHNYENKIANTKCNNAPADSSSKSGNNVINRLNTNNKTLSSNIPRYGSKIPSSFSVVKNTNDTKSFSNSSLSIDSNCNTVTDEMTPETCTTLTNGTEGHRPKNKFNDTSRRHSKHSNCFVSNSECKQPNSETSNHRSNVKENSCDGGRKPKGRSACRSAPQPVSTSGLPRPQTLNVTSKGAIAARNSIMKSNFLTEGKVQAPLAKLDDMEIMHLSSDTLPEDETADVESSSIDGSSARDTRIRIDGGSDRVTKSKNSVSQNRNDGKNQSSATKRLSSKNNELNQNKKAQANTTIPRPKGLPVLMKPSSNAKPNSSNNLMTKVQNKVKLFNGTQKQRNGKNDVAKTVTDKVEQKATSKQKTEKQNGENIACKNKTLASSGKTGPTTAERDKEKPVASAMAEQLKNDKGTEMSSSIESSGSQQDSSLQETGMFSPPSERDQFLIDDEIADQPELMACQPHEYQRIHHSSQDTFLDQDLFLGDIACESGEMCRTHSRETLCSASSINSDDLMLDFDQEETSAFDARCQGQIKWPRRRRVKSSSISEVDVPSSAHQMQMTAEEADDGTKNQLYALDCMVQDAKSVKSMLLTLKKALTEAETLNPFDSLVSKNGLFHNATQKDIQCGSEESTISSEQIDDVKQVKQENFDLQRQVVFLQQQLEEKNKACRLLQYQLTKRGGSSPLSPQKDVSNAATQTDKPRLSLATMSQSCEDSINGATTVSSNESGNAIQEMKNSSVADGSSAPITSFPVTRSLNSLLSSSNIAKRMCNGASSAMPERSASAAELHQQHSVTISRQPVCNNSATNKSSGLLTKLPTKVRSSEPASSSARSKIATRKGTSQTSQTEILAKTSKSAINYGVTSSPH